jgi:dTDP-4-dehydrorhamnose reductase
MKRPILVFGSTSLVGSDFTAEATSRFEVHAVGRSDPAELNLGVHQFHRIDLTDEHAVRDLLAARSGDVAWINFAARTDVDGCERERLSDPQKNPDSSSRADSAWRMNADFPGWLAEASAASRTPLIHLSTDFVFDGTAGPYQEDDLPSPLGPRLSWYGYTKGMGEQRIRHSGAPALTLRISYPYRARFESKTDLARNLLARGRAGRLFPLYSDQRITPTWVPDVTGALLAVTEKAETGTLHVASPETTSPLEFAACLFREFHLDVGPLKEARLAEQPARLDRAPRPILGGLGVRRAQALGLLTHTYRDGIRAMATDERADPPQPSATS